MATVGIIANPAAGKDIRRIVAHGRFIPNQEKVNVLKRILSGLDGAGVKRVVFMPDSAMLGKAALHRAEFDFDAQFLEMPVSNEEQDSSRAAELMAGMGVDCLVTLGGDGTNRVVAKHSRDIPLVPVSTGTNNVFPTMVEGTVAGLAAGVVANGLVDIEKTTTANKRLEVYIRGQLRDIALIPHFPLKNPKEDHHGQQAAGGLHPWTAPRHCSYRRRSVQGALCRSPSHLEDGIGSRNLPRPRRAGEHRNLGHRCPVRSDVYGTKRRDLRPIRPGWNNCSSPGLARGYRAC